MVSADKSLLGTLLENFYSGSNATVFLFGRFGVIGTGNPLSKVTRPEYLVANPERPTNEITELHPQIYAPLIFDLDGIWLGVNDC